MGRRRNRRSTDSVGVSSMNRMGGWLSVLLWLAESSKCSAGIPQHRVRTAQREVLYGHVREGRSRKAVERFWVPHSTRDLVPTTSPGRRKLRGGQSLWESWTESLAGKQHVIRRDEEIVEETTVWTSWTVHVKDVEGIRSTDNNYRHTIINNNKRNDETKAKQPRNYFGRSLFHRQRKLLVSNKFINDPNGLNTTAMNAAVGNATATSSYNVSATIQYISLDATSTDSNSSTFNQTSNHHTNNNNSSSSHKSRSHVASSIIFTTAASKSNSNDTANGNNDTTSTTSTYQPIRIRVVLSEQSISGGDLLSTWQRDILFQDILSPALLAWSSALRVDPVVGNLTVDVNQLFDGATCGPGKDSGHPSVPVPPSHLTFGVPDTDMLVYLSLGFAAGTQYESNSHIHPTTAAAASSSTTTTTTTTTPGSTTTTTTTPRTMSPSPTAMPSTLADAHASNEWFVQQSDNSSNGALPAVVEYLNWTERQYQSWSAQGVNSSSSSSSSSTSSPASSCNGDYLASATYCSTDQYDRPTAAMLHLCIDDGFFWENATSRNIITVMHELGHALGFNALSLAHFRNADGTPLTPRDANGDVVDHTIECTGPKPNGPAARRQYASVALPSSQILQFQTVRGGVRVAEIVTPSVQQVARNHFSCQTLPGAELESGGGGGGLLYSNNSFDAYRSSCIGDHWSRLLFRMDIMNPIIDDVMMSPLISTITLAYFADSGWYQVDLSRAAEPYGWGRGAGCNFVVDKCITGGGKVLPSNEPFFCNDTTLVNLTSPLLEINGCSPDLSSKATCSIGSYAHPIPPSYRYFNDSWVGGSDPFMEFCPVFSALEYGLCSISQNQAQVAVNPVELFGQKNSMCLSGSILQRKTALCIPIACVVEDQSLRILVSDAWQLCSYKNQTIPFGDGTGSVLCPDPIRTCPTFYCNLDCLGTGGYCDYETGECLCLIKNFTETGDLVGSCLDLHGNGSSTTVQFFDAATSRLLPGQESPLSDYYVPTKQYLTVPSDDSNELLVLVVLAVVIFLLIALWLYEHRTHGVSRFYRRSVDRLRSIIGRREQQQGSNPHDDNPLPPDVRANKDKMVAAVLVDMRIHDPTGLLAEMTAETESESDGSYLTEPDSEHFRFNTSSRSVVSIIGSEDDAGYAVDPLQPDDAPFNESRLARIIRRRKTPHLT